MVFKRMNAGDLDLAMTRKYYPMLTDQRKEKINEMRSPDERAVVFCSEILARQCLSELFDAPEFSFQLLVSPNGKSIVGNYGARLCVGAFGSEVVCAASLHEIGVCIEDVKPFSFEDAQNLCSDAELRRIFSESNYSFAELINLKSCTEQTVMQAFALFKSLKTAYFNATGKGFKTDIGKTVFLFENDRIVCSDDAYRVADSFVDTKKRIAVSVIERKE